MSSSSTSSAAPSRPTCRPTRNSVCRPEDITQLTVRNSQGQTVPIGTLASVEPTTGPPLISLYNLYPTATVIGIPVQGVSSGQAMELMEQMAARILPPGTGYEWTALSYQEKLVGNQMYLVFGLGILLVYLVLAGQYESWYAPLSIVLSVPLALVGPASVAARAEGRRQSLCADRPDPADRALGQERDPDRRGRARAARAAKGTRSSSRRSRPRARASARS